MLRNGVRWFFRMLVSLRYRVEIDGQDRLRNLKAGFLVLPNHPAYIDPMLLLTHFPRELRLRPMVSNTMYRYTWLRFVFWVLDALEVPSAEKPGCHPEEQVQHVLSEVIKGLQRGERFLIYPSGHIEHDGLEHLGSSRAVSEILKECPETKLALVRTTGLWGSMSSYAVTGRSPGMTSCIIRAIGTLLANLIFFAPKRCVKMKVEVAEASKLPSLEQDKVNSWLEDWYNRELSAQPVYVPYHFLFASKTHAFPKLERKASNEADSDTKKEVLQVLEEKLGRKLSDHDKDSENRLDDLGLDSLDQADLAQRLGEHFGHSGDEMPTTMGELMSAAHVAGAGKGKKAKTLKAPRAWTKSRPHGERFLSFEGSSLLEAFIRQAVGHPAEMAIADELLGSLSYAKLLSVVHAMSKRFEKYPADSVALMLPASVAADIVLLALLSTNKLPVLLNWTTGPKNLNHSIKVMKVQRVITSKKFVERLKIKTENSDYVFLEDVKKDIGIGELLSTYLSVRLGGKSWISRLPKRDPEKPALVLFTSGSEKAPKVVPLTHKNILSCMGPGAKTLKLARQDVLLGFLPPFHSFGSIGTMLLPILGGMRVVHHANPSDAPGLVQKITAYRATVLLSTPTFLDRLLDQAKPEDLQSVRLAIMGAESCPEAVYAKAREKMPNAVVTEGYGITECSPVISVNRPGHVKQGSVGQPLPDVEVRVVDPESRQPLSEGKQGLLFVHGPTVFHGYLHYEGEDPFQELDGKRWFVTGDLVQIDQEGFIRFTGRLTRFIKVKGEMVSLPALEQVLADEFPANENGPQVAIEAIENEKGAQIVLFTTTDVSLDQANDVLAKAKLGSLMRVTEVRKIDNLPTLGTGKIDYKTLQNQIEANKR